MSFKDNLKKKMLIDTLSRTVSQSIGSTERPWKVDKETMRRLLSLSPFVLEKRRNLELYFRQVEPGIGEILVLDNELPLYGKTTLDDVTLRKSPVLKEMISIRNVIKILHDSDVIMSKGRDALRYVHDRALDLLDLRFEEKDIEEMVNDGIDALARGDSEAVMETLDLFVELLTFSHLRSTYPTRKGLGGRARRRLAVAAGCGHWAAHAGLGQRHDAVPRRGRDPRTGGAEGAGRKTRRRSVGRGVPSRIIPWRLSTAGGARATETTNPTEAGTIRLH